MACALLYNFKDAARLQKVRFALFKLGVSGRVVVPEELSQPIGYLCDLEGFSPVEETVEGGFSDEMLVLCGLSGPQLDALLSSLRRSRVVVALKAVVTEDNAAWSSLQLHDELRQEHEAMKGTRQGCRKTLRAPQITLATAQSRRYNNRASNRSPIQVSIVSGYSEVGIAPALGAGRSPFKPENTVTAIP